MKIINSFAVLDLNECIRKGLIQHIERNKIRNLNKYVDTFKVLQDFTYKGINFKSSESFQREY